MVVDQVREYLEHGAIVNAVNFPNVEMPRESPYRVAIANANVPNMLGQISTTMAQAGLNIHNMVNKSRGEMAYTLVDVDSACRAGGGGGAGRDPGRAVGARDSRGAHRVGGPGGAPVGATRPGDAQRARGGAGASAYMFDTRAPIGMHPATSSANARQATIFTTDPFLGTADRLSVPQSGGRGERRCPRAQARVVCTRV